jgi:hypothetical protein
MTFRGYLTSEASAFALNPATAATIDRRQGLSRRKVCNSDRPQRPAFRAVQQIGVISAACRSKGPEP